MPAATPNLALPYPVAADPADVPHDIKALADRLDLSGGIGNTLPASPVDGQVYQYVPAAGVIWRLRYNAGSASAYKWEFIGGSSLSASFLASQAAAVGAWSQGAPQINLPRAGDYLFSFSAAVIPSAAGLIGLALTLPAGGQALDTQTAMQCTAGGEQALGRAEVPVLGTPAGAYQLGFYCAVATNFMRRYIAAKPIRIG